MVNRQAIDRELACSRLRSVLVYFGAGFPGAVQEKCSHDHRDRTVASCSGARDQPDSFGAWLRPTSVDAELHWENLDAIDISDDARNELRDGIVRKYRNLKWDLIVLVGPDPLRLFAEPSRTFYPGVPVVFCCSSPGQADQRSTDSRSTGSWLQWDPAKTVEAAIRLLPDTRQVFVVAGQSRYDRGLTAFVKAELNPYENRLNITYLTDLPMSKLLERVRHLPEPLHRSLSHLLQGYRGAGSF